jgi:hypothetical protein
LLMLFDSFLLLSSFKYDAKKEASELKEGLRLGLGLNEVKNDARKEAGVARKETSDARKEASELKDTSTSTYSRRGPGETARNIQNILLGRQTSCPRTDCFKLDEALEHCVCSEVLFFARISTPRGVQNSLMY